MTLGPGFQFQFPAYADSRRQQVSWLKQSGSCNPCGRPGFNFWFNLQTFGGKNQQMGTLCLYMSVTLKKKKSLGDRDEFTAKAEEGRNGR